jgi:uncharacterized protein YecE (DUF72 family)
MNDRALLHSPVDIPMRHAIEVRHPSYEKAEFVELLREHDIGLVCADTAGKWPMLDDVTSDFVYVRLHGADELYVSGYTDDELDRWAAKVQTWQKGGTPTDGRTVAPRAPRKRRDVYVYFDNDVKVHSPYDAEALAARLGVNPLT